MAKEKESNLDGLETIGEVDTKSAGCDDRKTVGIKQESESINSHLSKEIIGLSLFLILQEHPDVTFFFFFDRES